jgi:hypothetical protein
VEFALVLPTFLLVVVAVCQVALFLNCYLVVTASSREGARRGAETNDAGEARLAALRSCRGLPGAEPEVNVDFPDGRSKGKPVRVTVDYRVPLLVPGVSSLLGEPSFSRSTSMVLERGER